MPIPSFTMTLQAVEPIAPGVLHFTFSKDDGQSLQYIPGQFITIHFQHDERTLRRSYSIATIPGTSNNVVEFAASYVEGGPASELLFNAKLGFQIETTGPFGRLVLRDTDKPKRYLLCATGTGVTPYRAMLPVIRERMRTEGIAFVLLLGVQHREDLLYADEFATFANENPNFTFRAQLSRDAMSNPLPYEHKGYVQTAFAELALNPESDIVYLCGNPNMIDDAFADLKERGFDISNVRREKYISAK